ncbi:MAG: acyltransferase [Oscillospiraceae bacterium]|jgi:peptidoglycan/LPS O-acetylase OafA/YrhL|nr:acyltransferase [Oscillospiraceae bacterium]
MRIKWLGLARVLGLAMVLAYHFFKRLLPGGFFGVDLFFTLSGYLTTALIVEEFRKAGAFRWLDFCKRRFLRIFPPLLLSVLVTLPFALLISPDFTGGIARQAAGALGFVTNYLEILGGGSYEAQLLPHLYIHTWSLALEMHYYLLWGLACLGAAALLGRLVKKKENRPRWLKHTLALLAMVLAGLCWWNMRRLSAASPGNPTRAYFDSLSHALPFFAGSAAGALFGINLHGKAAAKLNSRPCLVASVAVMALAGGGLVAMGALFTFTEQKTYRYGFALAALLAALVICAARVLHEATPGVRRDPKALSFVADTSYGVYLFHWPLYIVFGNLLARNWLASLVTLALSLGLAAMTFYGIEPLLRAQPIPLIQKLWKKHWAMRVFYPAAAMLCLFGVAGSAQVFARAPAVTGLELPIMIGNIYQDAESAAALHARAAAIPVEPVADRGRAPFWADAAHDPSLADSAWVPAVSIHSLPGGVSYIGDSVSLGADRFLRETIPNLLLDAEVSRTMRAGRALLREWQDDGSLREYVVVALGSNGYGDWKAQIDGMLDELPAGCRMVFVTPFLGIPDPGTDDLEIAAYYRELARTLPYVTVADWAGVAAGRQELLAADKVHLAGNRGMQLFTDVVLQGIDEAGRKAGKPG